MKLSDIPNSPRLKEALNPLGNTCFIGYDRLFPKKKNIRIPWFLKESTSYSSRFLSMKVELDFISIVLPKKSRAK
jgi:hypothetical protein